MTRPGRTGLRLLAAQDVEDCYSAERSLGMVDRLRTRCHWEGKLGGAETRQRMIEVLEVGHNDKMHRSCHRCQMVLGLHQRPEGIRFAL
jgi:hypothetical protein